MTRRQVIDYWAWGVSGFLVIVGAIGMFYTRIGPLPTNRLHALGLNLGVGFVGFGFARFSREDVFVLLAGIGMIVLATLGLAPTSDWLYSTMDINRAETYIELGSGVISLAIWGLCARGRPRPPASAT